MADAERVQRQQQAAASNAAFWDTLLGVVATVGNAYVTYESQRAQIEANNQAAAAAAQAAANAAAMQQRQAAAAQPPQGEIVCIGDVCPGQDGVSDSCVTASMEFIPAARAGNGMDTYTVWFRNTCPHQIGLSARDSRGHVQWSNVDPAHGTPTTAHVLCTNCSGFSEWWISWGSHPYPHHPIG
jgi:hypothetical protein